MMEEDIFGEMPYGKLALTKFEKSKPVDPDFRIYYCGWLGDKCQSDVMEVTGAVFRKAKTGKNKGRLCIEVEGTRQTVYVTADEIDAYKKSN